MSNYPSFYHTMRWLRKMRLKKKWKLQKQAISMVIDFTSAIYLFFFLVICLFALRSYLVDLKPVLSVFSSFSHNWLLTILLALLIRAFLSSFRSPGIYLTSTEFQLTLLPYRRDKVWLYCFLENAIRKTVFLAILYLFLYFLVPMDKSIIFLFVFTLWLGNLIGIVIQWRIFQINGWRKFFLIIGLSLVFAVLRLLISLLEVPSREILFVGYAITLVVGILLISTTSLRNVDWARVVSFGDAKVWNMMLVQQVTKVKIKPPKKFQLFNRIFHGKRAKRPLPYDLARISIRLWRPFLKENLEIVFRTLGIFLLLMIGFGSQGTIPLQISLAIGLVAVNQVISSLFVHYFYQPIMYALPWRFSSWYQSFKKWYIPFMVIYSIAALGLFYFHGVEPWIMIAHLIFYLLWMRIDVDISVQAKINFLKKQEWGNSSLYLTRLIGLVAIFFTIPYPWISFIASIIILVYLLVKGAIIKIDTAG